MNSIHHFLTALLILPFAFLGSASTSKGGSLIEAIQAGDLYQVEQEIANGADVSKEDIFLGAPIILAVIQGNAEIVEFLISHGALVQHNDHASGTPLHAASLSGHLEVVELLIEHGADITAHHSANGETPLHAASQGGSLEIVEMLISKGANVNARSNDNYGPIHSAATSEHFDVVDLLLTKGAAPEYVEPVAPLFAEADPNEGARLFSGKCRQCHSTEKSGENRAGPNLWGIIGRRQGSLSDFDYSAALIRSGKKWGYEELNLFLARPTDFVPGTKMVAMYPSVEDKHERAHIISYLRQLSEAPAAHLEP